jgi:glycine/D-amino acid oxidase-like deaminating enzyme
MGHEIRSIQKKEGIFLIKTSRGEIRARQIVNAAGAWASLVGKKAGAARVPLKAYRRHIFVSKQYRAPTSSSWPFVWDLGLGFYFRPVEDGLLMSPCDHTWERLERDGGKSSRREQIDPKMKLELFRKARRFSPYFSKLRIATGKSGLRTMAPDGRFVIGADPKLKGFFWCAGLGGHGVTTCFSVGRLSADIVLGRKTDEKIIHALSPARFKGK